MAILIDREKLRKAMSESEAVTHWMPLPEPPGGDNNG